MRQLTILLTFCTVVSFGQNNLSECLDSPIKFKLFRPHINFKIKCEPVVKLDNYLMDSIYLHIDFKTKVNYDYAIKGLPIYMVNSTAQDIELLTTGVLDILCQAQIDGKWITIELLEESWGADLSREFTIDKMSFYRIIFPCYTGTIQTKLRYRFILGDKIYYSEEFLGSINEGQLRN